MPDQDTSQLPAVTAPLGTHLIPCIESGTTDKGITVDQIQTPNQWINAKHGDDGAVGGGVIDDTTAILGKLAAAHAAGGGFVYLDVGIYLVTGIDMDGLDNVTLVGTGRSTQILVNSDTFGIKLDNCTRCHLRNLYIKNTGTPTAAAASGINALAVGEGSTDCTVTDVEIEGFWHGVRLSDESTGWTFTRVHCHDNLHSGFMGLASGTVLDHCKTKDNGTTKLHHGIYINALEDELIENIQIIAPEVSGNAGDGISIVCSGSSNGGTIRGVHVTVPNIYDNGAALDSSAGNRVAGMSFAGTVANDRIEECSVVGGRIENQQGDGGTGIAVISRTRRVSFNGVSLTGFATNFVICGGGVGVQDITLDGLPCYDCDAEGFLLGADRIVVKGGTLEGTNGDRAIRVTGDEVSIAGTIIGGTWSGDGIRLEGTDDCTVVGAVTGGHTIRIVATANRNVVVGNATNGGGVVDGGANSQVANNS